MVSDPNQARLDSFRGYDWYSMDNPLHLDGHRCMDRVAPRGVRGAAISLGDLCYTTPPERRMVGSIFRSPEPGLGSFRNRHLVDCDPGNFSSVLACLEVGGCTDGALSDLGVFRWGPERHDLAAELIPKPSSQVSMDSRCGEALWLFV